jgi:hypothetical protein
VILVLQALLEKINQIVVVQPDIGIKTKLFNANFVTIPVIPVLLPLVVTLVTQEDNM